MHHGEREVNHGGEGEREKEKEKMEEKIPLGRWIPQNPRASQTGQGSLLPSPL